MNKKALQHTPLMSDSEQNAQETEQAIARLQDTLEQHGITADDLITEAETVRIEMMRRYYPQLVEEQP